MHNKVAVLDGCDIFTADRKLTSNPKSKLTTLKSVGRARVAESISNQLICVQENERKRIARELHDGVGQALSATKLSMENLQRELGGHVPSHSLDQIEQVIGRVRHAIEEVRRISMDLRPAMLDDLGLTATINWLCREFRIYSSNTDVVKDIEFNEADIPEERKTVIFRILQEALNNVAKHAQANRVWVQLSGVQFGTKLSVRDDGCGFEVADATVDTRAMGLKSMWERAQISGGAFYLSSTSSGTVVEVMWPPGTPPT